MTQASVAERGNLRLRCKRKNPSGRTARMKVRMRSIGAEQPVVAMKFLKGNRAKGLYYSVLEISQP